MATDFSNSYGKTYWEPGLAITQKRMNALEDGVETNRDNTIALYNTIGSDNTNGLQKKIKDLEDSRATNAALTELDSNLRDEISSQFEQAVNVNSEDLSKGVRAFNEIKKVVQINNNTNETTYGLDDMKDGFDSAIRTIQDAIGKDSNGNLKYNTTNNIFKDVDTLKAAIGRDANGNLDYYYSATPANSYTVTKRFEIIEEELTNARYPKASLAQRLQAILTDEIAPASDKATFAFNQIDGALRKNLVDENDQSIDDSLYRRFTEITQAITTLDQNKLTVDPANIIDGYTSSDSLKVLSANAGRILRNMIGGSYTGENDNTVAHAISSAYNDAVAAAAAYADEKLTENNISEISDAHRVSVQNDTLRRRFEDYEGLLTSVAGEVTNAHRNLGTDSEGNPITDTLMNRFRDIEDELTDAHLSTVKGTEDETTHEITPASYNSLDERFEAVETDIQTIANELSMYDIADNITGTTSRIDQLETNVVAMANEIGMLQNGAAVQDMASAINGDRTRIDAIDSDLNTATTGIKARLDAIDTPSTGSIATLAGRVQTVENTIGDASTGLAATKAIADANATAISHAAEGNDPGGLTERITALETATNATTIIISVADFETLTANAANSINDYLVGPDNDGLYKYYHIIETSANTYEKVLISGGGTGNGTGTSSAIIAAALPELAQADENIDYYIGNNNNGYIHYRYIAPEQNEVNGHFITVLPKNLINNASVLTVNTTNEYTDIDAWPATSTISGGLAAYALEDTQHFNNLFNDFVAVRNARINAVYDGEELKSQTFQVLDTKGHLMEYPIVGGSGGNAYSIRFLPTLANTTFTVPQDSNYHTIVKAKAIVKQGNTLLDGVSFSGEVQYQLSSEAADVWHRSILVLPAITNNTEFEVDVSSILPADSTTKVRLSLDINTGDGDPINRTVDYTITKTQVAISSTFDPSVVLTSANLVIHYTCYGINLNKTVHFKIDGTDAITPITTSSHNTELNATIPLLGLANGSHTLQIYFTTSGDVTSNKLNYYIIYNLDENRQEPIIGLNAAYDSIIDGEELIVNYTAYTPGKETTEKVEIQLFVLDDQDNATPYSSHIDTLTNVPITNSTWRTAAYPTPVAPEEGQPEQPIRVQVKITAYNTVTTIVDEQIVNTVYTTYETTNVTINRFTNPNNYDFSVDTDNNLLYSYNAYGKTNNDVDRANYEYTYTANDQNATEITFHGTFNGFNWATNGYMDDGSLLISGGAKHYIDVPIFSSNYNGITIESQSAQDITQYGRTIEIDYEVRSATDLNATIIECMDPETHAGFRITPSYCYLTNKTTEAEVDTVDGFILNESSIAAAYLQTNTRIHLMFVIEPWSNNRAFDGTYHQSVNIYINGEYANSCPYERNSNGAIIDDFSSTATMVLGSDTCILKVYSIKMYNRGLNDTQALQAYKLAPSLLNERLNRFANNDVLTNGEVDYEKAKRRFNCLLLKGPDPTDPETLDWPTISPFKGSPSPAKRKKKASATDYEGKTESGLIFTKPSSDPSKDGFVEEFNLCDKVPAGAPAYMGATGAYCSTNNVQGTSSQKYPLHNLKVYLAKWQDEKTTTKNVALEPGEEVEEGVETVEIDGVTYKVVTETTPAQIKKVKYSLKGYNNDGTPKGTEESTLCWKADFMSTDHANTYNANIADELFSDELQPNWKNRHLQNTVYGVRCMLFVQQGDNAPIKFVGDGCLNNDKGNTKTFGLDDDNDDGNDTLRQKWEFTNNSSPLDVFKSDNLFAINEKDSNRKIFAKGAFECNYPDEGDLKEDNIEPNYNHLQLLLTWVNKRACYLDYSVYDDTDGSHVDYTISDAPNSGGTYNGVNYSTERELKKAIFKNEFEDHFNLNHVLTYYLLSEYVALCDNRAKNMFLRSEDIRSEVIRNDQGQIILNGNEYPDDGTLWNQYVNTTTGITNPAKIDWASGAGHSTFAKWAPVLYDLDSCFGVENVGLITIKYNADWQYKYNNKEAFSGFDSVFWLMVEDTYEAELRTLAKQLYDNELNFTNFYRQQITGNLSATCPAVTNQDMILKYQKPWNEGFINYAESPDPVTGLYPVQTPLYKYIQRGTRTTQKTTFMRQRSMLLSSKYVSNEFINSMISFRAGVQVTGENTLLTLVANQDLYPAIIFSDNNTLVRPTSIIVNNQTQQINSDFYVPAGVPCNITTSQIGNSDTVKIVGASVLNDIGDISKYQPYELKVGSGANLKRLIIGSDAPGYINTQTESIEGLADCVLLEEINVRNTTKISSLNLGGNGLIKKVYAKGSNITTISLPNGGILEEIEYGSKTTNITLLNQNFLNTFYYENANAPAENTYSSLNKLWVENTPNVPIVDIINKAMQRLVNGVRLINIDVQLGNDDTFLQTITSDFAKGKKMTNNGAIIINNTDYPTITGKVQINQIRESLLTTLHKNYPDLIIYASTDTNGNPIPITGNNVINEFTIKYYNYDGTTLLYTDHRTDLEQYIDPVSTYVDDLDPITHQARIPIPEKPETAQYYYTFGEYEDDGEGNLIYIRFSGWKKEGSNSNPSADDYVSGDTKFIAQFPTTTDRYYTVMWYAEPNETPLNSMTVKYGQDISTLTQPEESTTLFPMYKRAKTDQNTGITKVFKGWDRPAGRITSDMNIYALWETSTIGNSIQSVNMSTLNAADLYAISNLGYEAKNRIFNSLTNSKLDGAEPIAIKMGTDFYYTSGVNMTDLLNGAEKITLTGSSTRAQIKNNITPLADLASDWTLAIDYKFLMDNSTYTSGREFVLLSCYKNANSSIQGFKVSLMKGSSTSDAYMYVHVTWGTATTSTPIDTIYLPGDLNSKQYCKTQRNVIVLRHNATEPDKLYIYYTGFIGQTYDYSVDAVPNAVLTWSNNTAINTPLIIGGNYSGDTQVIEANATRRPAKAIVYWGKFWDTDLGATSCRNLALWPHETEYFVLTGYDNNEDENSGNSTRIISGTKLSFAAVQGFGDRQIVTPSLINTANGRVGWAFSKLREFCQNRIFKAFPITYRSIIGTYDISSNYFDNTSSSDMHEEVAVTQDQIYLPCEREVSNRDVGTINKAAEALRFWPWLSAANINAVTISSDVLVDATIANINPLLYRFINRATTTENRIFYNTPDPTSNDTWIYKRSGEADQIISVQSGDIWYTEDANVNSEFSGSPNAYIYYTNDEINEGIYVDIVTTNGGWKRAGMWELRTYYINENATAGQPARFEKINETGTLIKPGNNNAALNSTWIICPEFSI